MRKFQPRSPRRAGLLAGTSDTGTGAHRFHAAGEAASKDPVLSYEALLQQGRRLSGHVFANKAELQTAANEWCTDEAAATATYGPIPTWDTSAVTDMSDLFWGKAECNPPIGDWDTGAVTSMR